MNKITTILLAFFALFLLLPSVYASNEILRCQPRPECLDSNPPCAIAEPFEGWCAKIPSGNPTCTPRPACLEQSPPCKKIIPNLCPPSVTPLPKGPIACGGSLPVICPTGYSCKFTADVSKGGICTQIAVSIKPNQFYANQNKGNIFSKIWGFFSSLFVKN